MPLSSWKKGPIIRTLFAYSRGAGASLFWCGRHKDTQVMGTCLGHVEVFIRDRFFFMNFVFECSEEGWIKEKLS